MDFKDGKTKTGIISSLITLVVVGLLIFAGPAQALTVSLGAFSNSNPTQGDVIYIDASIEIDSLDRVILPYVNLTINGADYCIFDAIDGSNLSSCTGISITPLFLAPSPDFGYGYGYGYNFNTNQGYGYGYGYGFSDVVFNYNISIDTSYFSVGSYDLQLNTPLGSQTYSSSIETFNVLASTGGSCINSFQFGTTTLVNGDPNPVVATTCAFISEYSVFNNIALGHEYMFTHTSSSSLNYITITDTLNNVLAVGPSPLVWNSTINGSVRLHYSNDGVCSTSPGGCRTGQAQWISGSDNLAPVTSVSATLQNGSTYQQGSWSNQDVGLDFTCTDNTGCLNTEIYLNGLSYANYSASSFMFLNINQPGVNVVTFWSGDNFGNVETPQNFTVRITAEGPTGIGGDWIFPDGSTPENTPNITAYQEIVIPIGTGNVTIPAGTIITRSDGLNLNLTELTSSLQNATNVSGLDGVGGVIEFGIPSIGLTFDPAITVNLAVDSSFNGQNLSAFRSSSLTSDWQEIASCSVANEICSFQTTQASYFAAAESITSTPTTTTTSSTGGSCLTQWQVSEWSECIDGVQTRTVSYPANFCTPRAPMPEETQSCVPEVQPEQPEDVEQQDQQTGLMTLLTGLVIGDFLANPVNLSITLIILIVLIALAVFIIKKRKAAAKKKSANKKKSK